MSEPGLTERITEIERLLSKPSATPSEFSSWIVKWLVANMDISGYQVRGLASTFFKAAPVIGTSEATSSLSFVNLATVGPTLSGLSNGHYLAFWGANMGSTTDSIGNMGMSPNGGGPSDEQAAKGRVTAPPEVVPIVYSRDFTLEGNDQNYLQAKYMRVAGAAPKFGQRWLVAVQVGK